MLKVTAFWDVAPCSLVQATDVSEVLTASVIRVSHGPDNGCITHILNYGLILQDYMAPHCRRLKLIFILVAVRT
jgi:hypothetical protein